MYATMGPFLLIMEKAIQHGSVMSGNDALFVNNSDQNKNKIKSGNEIRTF